MFDIGFSELMIIGIVGLVVIGPERLPRVARTVGHLLGRLQRYVGDVKSDIQREMQLDDLKKLQQQVAEQARDLENNIKAQSDALSKDMHSTAESLNSAVAGLATDTEVKAPAVPDDASLADAERQIAAAVSGGDADSAPTEPGATTTTTDDGQLALGLSDSEKAAAASTPADTRENKA